MSVRRPNATPQHTVPALCTYNTYPAPTFGHNKAECSGTRQGPPPQSTFPSLRLLVHGASILWYLGVARMTVGDVHEPSPARGVCLLLAVGGNKCSIPQSSGVYEGNFELR